MSERPSSPRPRWRRPLVAVHVMASVGAFGADLVLLVLGVAARRCASPETTYPAMHTLATWLLAPLAVIAVVTGVALALGTGRGLFRHPWVTVKFAVTVTLATLVLVVLLPGLADVTRDATGTGEVSEATSTRYVVVPALSSALLALNVFLAVFKPGDRRGLASRAQPRSIPIT